RSFSAISHDARTPRPDNERRIIGKMIGPNKVEVESLEQDAPNHFDLLLGKRQSDASMPSTAETDQPVGCQAIFFAAWSKTIGIIFLRIPENVGKPMRSGRRDHCESSRLDLVSAEFEIAQYFSHQHDQRRPQSLGFLDGMFQAHQFADSV